jgi:hypothetical protein
MLITLAAQLEAKLETERISFPDLYKWLRDDGDLWTRSSN